MSTDLGRRPVRRALIGVSDKAGLLDLATGLHAAGVEIVSTGGTAKVIADAGVPVTPVEDVTGFPESLDGRVKTLHPRVHAGLLADQGNPDHVEQLRKLEIAAFDLLVVNLYPFEQTVASGASPEDCVENIDIGGPAMVRAAAKNHGSVAVVVDPARYGWVLERVADGGFDLNDRKRLAAQAYAHTASYDIAVASWFSSVYAPDEDAVDSGFPEFSGISWERGEVLRYGENPHQKAALYKGHRAGLAHAEQHHHRAGDREDQPGPLLLRRRHRRAVAGAVTGVALRWIPRRRVARLLGVRPLLPVARLSLPVRRRWWLLHRALPLEARGISARSGAFPSGTS